MSDYDTARLIYLGLLGFGILGFFLVQNRNNLGKTAQQGLIWVFLFIGVASAYQLWDDIRRDAARGQMTQIGRGQVAVPVHLDGHYYLTLDINNTPVRFVVDTGASEMVLTQDDAQAVGLNTDALIYSGLASTANGTVRTAPVQLDVVQLGDVTDTQLRAVVNGGEMDKSLLGMEYLQRWQMQFSNGELVLSR